MKFRRFSAISAAIALISCCSVAAQATDYKAASYADNNPGTCNIESTTENSVTVSQATKADFVKIRMLFGDIVSNEDDCAKIASGSFKVTYNGLKDKTIGYMGGAAYVSASNGNSTDWSLSSDGSKDSISFDSTFKCTPGNAKLDGEIVFMDWSKNDFMSEGITITISDIKIFDKDGNEIATKPYSGEAAPAETTAAETTAETTKAETKEEVTEAPTADEDEDTTAAADEDLVEDDDDDDAAAAGLSAEDLADLDLDALAAEVGYDYAGAVASNAAFELGGKIDLIAALGENWDKFTTIEADFSWTPGEKWCGGAGIGAAINCNGDTWIMGDEFGAANANEAVAPDGKATQTILKMAGPLISPVSIGEDGSVGFGELQVQNWWNGKEAGAKVDAIRFLDDNGNVVAELKYSADAADAAPVVAPATGDVEAATDSSKGSPDTGVADVAAVAGLAVLAAGAVVVAKKRK